LGIGALVYNLAAAEKPADMAMSAFLSGANRTYFYKVTRGDQIGPKTIKSLAEHIPGLEALVDTTNLRDPRLTAKGRARLAKLKASPGFVKPKTRKLPTRKSSEEDVVPVKANGHTNGHTASKHSPMGFSLAVQAMLLGKSPTGPLVIELLEGCGSAGVSNEDIIKALRVGVSRG
jgi:hypothetical protein